MSEMSKGSLNGEVNGDRKLQFYNHASINR